MNQASETTPSTAPPTDRASEFRPVEGGGPSTSEGAMLGAAYFLMWALVLGFVVLGFRRQKALGARIAALEAARDRAESPPR